MDDRNNIIVAGHRGYKTKYPENTLISFKKALDVGVDMIEFDLNLTKDHKLVVIHDEKVDRTTNGSGYVRDMLLCEVKELDAGVWFDEAFKGERVPTFEEFLETVSVKKDLLFNVEIKEKTFETVDKTVDTLKAFDVIDRCVMTCFDANIVKYMNSKYGLRCQGFPGRIMKNFEEGDAGTYSHMYAAGIDLKFLTQDMVDFFVNQNILPWAYCVNDEAWAQKCIDLGVTLVTCDNPVPALNLFKSKGYHK